MKHEQLRKECDELIASNKRFYDLATKFREKYSEHERHQADLERFATELQNILDHVKEMTGEVQHLIGMNKC